MSIGDVNEVGEKVLGREISFVLIPKLHIGLNNDGQYLKKIINKTN